MGNTRGYSAKLWQIIHAGGDCHGNSDHRRNIAETGNRRTLEVQRLSLTDQGHGDLGLRLEDAKDLLGRLWKAVLNAQVEDFSQANRRCQDCKQARRVHDYRTRVLDTLFGRFEVRVPRLRKCSCRLGELGSCSPFAQVFPDRATPELRRLQTELGALHSFREAARILQTFLPRAEQHNTTVRNRLGRIAKDITRSEPLDIEVPSSNTVTDLIDGAHIRCRPEYQKRHLHVVAGKIEGNNLESLTNYGRRYRQSLPTSTFRAEGCVDDIGNACMGKRRRM